MTGGSSMEMHSTYGKAAVTRRPSLLQALQAATVDRGWTGLWRGNGLNVLRAGPQKAIDFFSFELYKVVLACNHIQASHHPQAVTLELHIWQGSTFNALCLILHAQADPHAQFSRHPCPAAVSASYISNPHNTHIFSAMLLDIASISLPHDAALASASITELTPFTHNITRSNAAIISSWGETNRIFSQCAADRVGWGQGWGVALHQSSHQRHWQEPPVPSSCIPLRWSAAE